MEHQAEIPVNVRFFEWMAKISRVETDIYTSKRDATGEERAELAGLLDIESLDKFICHCQIRPLGRGRYLLNGGYMATLVQQCAVSLEPFSCNYDEAMTLELWPDKQFVAHYVKDNAFDFGPSDEPGAGQSDLPEPFDGRQIGLGALFYEHLAMAIDPFARKPGATFDDTVSDAGKNNTLKANPFAVLEKLKKS